MHPGMAAIASNDPPDTQTPFLLVANLLLKMQRDERSAEIQTIQLHDS